jgi:hypothetical protein
MIQFQENKNCNKRQVKETHQKCNKCPDVVIVLECSADIKVSKDLLQEKNIHE